MSSKYFKSIPNFNSNTVNVDRENGIIKNTCIAEFGQNQNDSFFDEIFLSELVRLGNEADGIKSRFGHPNMCATSFGTFIGRYRNFQLKDGNVYGDLHLDNTTKSLEVEGKGMKMFDYILTMAENNPDMFGNSIHIYSETYQKPIQGKVRTLHKLEKFKACDLVDEPAATSALFSNNANDLGIIVTQFLDENPQIFETISKQPDIMENFFSRYANYSNRKSLINFNMNFLDKIKKQFSAKREGETFDIDITLANRSIVTVITEAEQPQVGDPVVDESGTPVADATHLLPDGSSIVTVGGKITEILPKKEDTGGDEEPTMQDVMNSVSQLANQFSAFQKLNQKTQNQNEEAFDVLRKEMTRLGKEIKSKEFQKPSGEQGKPEGGKERAYDPEKAAELRKK